MYSARRLAFFLFLLSGALALVYEVVWLRLAVLVFGSTQFAVTSVLAAFMAGLALGSYVFGRYVDSVRQNPLALYAVLELGIGLFALGVPYALNSAFLAGVTDLFGGSFYTANLARFISTLLVLLIPTTLMGGTLPALTRFVTRREVEIAASVGALYAANTIGAVVGTTITGLWLIPRLGVSNTIYFAAAGNVVLAVVAFAAARRAASGVLPTGPVASAQPVNAAPARDRRDKRRKEPLAPEPSRVALWAAAGSGLLALVYEITWTRILTLVLGSSVYAFTAMLATFLAGLAAGAFISARLVDRLRTGAGVLKALATTVAVAALTGYAGLLLFPRLPAAFARAFNAWGLASATAVDGGNRALQLISIEFAFAFLVMFPATVCMGIVFPLAVRLWVGRLDVVGTAVGTVYAVNTVGTILGSILAGFVILPLVGLQGGILAAVCGGLLLAAGVAWSIADWTRMQRVLVTVGAALLCAVFVGGRPSWDPLVMNSGIYQYAPDLRDVALTAEEFADITHKDVEILYYEEGLTANVLVGRRPSTGNVFLSINGKIDASSNPDLETQLLLGHLPMLLASPSRPPDDRNVAVIGYATGITTGAVTQHRPARVAAVEIEAAVLRASAFFDPFNHRPLSNPAVRPVVADGRTFLLTDPDRYDVIVSEPSSPWMTIAANLFTREFFEIGRRRLAPGGIFCQWIQLYGLPPEDLRSLIHTFASVFPRLTMFWGIPGEDIILLGSNDPIGIDIRRLAESLAAPAVAADLARINVRDAEDLLAYYVMDEAGIRAFVGNAPLNTDDNALIEFRAPLTMHVWSDTLETNATELRAASLDPLTRVTGLPEDPQRQAVVYARLALAYHNRRMFDRAVAALRRAEGLHPTDEGARRLKDYETAAQAAATK